MREAEGSWEGNDVSKQRPRVRTRTAGRVKESIESAVAETAQVESGDLLMNVTGRPAGRAALAGSRTELRVGHEDLR